MDISISLLPWTLARNPFTFLPVLPVFLLLQDAYTPSNAQKKSMAERDEVEQLADQPYHVTNGAI
jgi:hypothetical protein